MDGDACTNGRSRFGSRGMPKRADRPARILIAEDNPHLQDLLVEYASVLGYEPMAVVNGEEALAAAAAWPPDLMICDVGLPDVSGVEVCMRFKASPETQDVPVLLITGLGEDHASRISPAGPDGILWKPFELDELRAEIRRLLGGGG